MPRHDYEERKAARIARLSNAAENAQQEAERRCAAAKQMLDIIPPGQPILIGHHSEKGHRAHLRRVNTNFRKASEADKAAEEYAHRAHAAKTNRAISADDPQAVEKIRAKIVRAEALQARMVAANKALRQNDTDALHALGFDDVQIEKLREPDFCGRTGFPSYALTNNSAEIRRLKQRLAQLEKQSAAPESAWHLGPVEIVTNPAENRLQIFFAKIPPESIRQDLKSHGFRWSPSAQAWQRMPSEQATFHALRIAQVYKSMSAGE